MSLERAREDHALMERVYASLDEGAAAATPVATR
jgi:hypothetical protein